MNAGAFRERSSDPRALQNTDLKEGKQAFGTDDRLYRLGERWRRVESVASVFKAFPFPRHSVDAERSNRRSHASNRSETSWIRQ